MYFMATTSVLDEYELSRVMEITRLFLFSSTCIRLLSEKRSDNKIFYCNEHVNPCKILVVL